MRRERSARNIMRGSGWLGSRSGRKIAIAAAALGGMAVLNILRDIRASGKPAVNYSNRSGFPKSPRDMRGAAREYSETRMSETEPWMDGDSSKKTSESWPQNSDN